MTTRTAVLLLCGAVAVGTMVHCGGSNPAQPPPVTTTTTTTTTTMPAGIVLPAGYTCDPTPPPLYGIPPKPWDKSNPGRWIIDSSPLVVNVDDYCARVGAGGSGQKWCFTRAEGDPQRVACDYLAVGKSSETGRWGPTWSFNGQPCDPPGAPAGGSCANHPDNQFRALAKASGTFQACASELARVDPGGSRCNSKDVNMQ